MIQTLASLALDAGHDLLAPEKRFVEVPSEKYVGLSGPYAQTDTGLKINEANALTYMPVLACTRVISETLASLPLKIYRDTDNGPEVARGHYLYPILHDVPNPEMTSFTFWECLAVSLCLYNNAYAEIEWNNAGRVRALWPLLPGFVTQRRLKNGDLVFDYTTDTGKVPLPAKNVLHIPGCLNLAGLQAESLIKWAREAIGLGLAPQKFAANFYKNNARPGAYITTPNGLTETTRKMLAASWNDLHAGLQGAGKMAVLEGGMEIKVPSMSNTDSELSKTREFQLQEVARMYRVPLHLLGDLSRSTNNNIEHQGIEFATHTMTPYCRRSEQALNWKLIGVNSGYYAEFSLDALMRGDLLSRTQAYAQAINTAQKTPNEVRKLENLQTIKGGDKLYIQGANVPLEMAGKHLEQQPQQNENKTGK